MIKKFNNSLIVSYQNVTLNTSLYDFQTKFFDVSIFMCKWFSYIEYLQFTAYNCIITEYFGFKICYIISIDFYSKNSLW